MDTNEERLIHLETQLAFQDDLLEQLNQQLIRQDQSIRNLQDQIRILSTRFKELQQAASEPVGQQPSLADERPPHY